MGKKSRRNRGTTGELPNAQQQAQETLSNIASNISSQPQPQTPTQAIFYTSDGPSDVELLQTTSPTLQLKLNQLTLLGQQNNRPEFVSQFIPLDLVGTSDAAGYLEDLTTAPEAEGQWTNLIAEIAAIRCGKGVNRIEGDQINNAVFYFEHPLLKGCDREVSFICVDGEWRAEG